MTTTDQSQRPLFIDGGLSPQLVDDLRRLNPWWEDAPMPPQPKTRRHLVGQIRRRLEAGLAPIVVVRGPRQVGKTTAQYQMISDLLNEGMPPTNILRVQFDELDSLKGLKDPILRISDWFERQITQGRFNSLAENGRPAYLFFDEVQNLNHWSTQLKSLVDSADVKVVVTGSSALRITKEKGDKEGEPEQNTAGEGKAEQTEYERE